jgi:hypothetical protein
MNWQLSVLLSSVITVISGAQTTPASATCLMPLLSTNNRYCDGCRYEGTISLNHNETCERVSQVPQTAGMDYQYVDSRIIQRAKHGVAGANGATIAYQPAKDFVGTDDFAMEMTYRENGKLGKYTAHYVVTVK